MISMRKLLIILSTILIIVCSCSSKNNEKEVFVEGGYFKNTKSPYYGKGGEIEDFYMEVNEVSQKEWIEVMETNPSKFKGENLPVETVSWYDCVDYCNKKSIKDGLNPYYTINKNKKDPLNDNEIDSLKWVVSYVMGANGYRLPTVEEWEYASGGGQLSKSYTYSGSNKIEEVAWYWRNSGDKFLMAEWSYPKISGNRCRTQTIKSKNSNELGLYDMSGNVREWCWEWKKIAPYPRARSWKGGGWLGSDECCESIFHGNFEASGRGPDQGFRICRNK
jgi:formylglycine-generating enzyme